MSDEGKVHDDGAIYHYTSINFPYKHLHEALSVGESIHAISRVDIYAEPELFDLSIVI